MEVIELHTPYITLGQLLKIADFVSSGGETKWFLENEKITVNQELEQRRGRKLYPGDIITIQGRTFTLKAQ